MINAPKVFISYCYLPPEEHDWVKILADRIRAAGISLTMDKDKAADMDMDTFVVNTVNDRSYTHILIICNDYYKRMADSRGKEIDIEGPVIIDRLYEINENKRFIPIIHNTYAGSENPMPRYLSKKEPVVFPDPDTDMNNNGFNTACSQLIERILANNETGTMNTGPDGTFTPPPRHSISVSGWSVISAGFVLFIYIIRIAIRLGHVNNSYENDAIKIVNNAPHVVMIDGKAILIDSNGEKMPSPYLDYLQATNYNIKSASKGDKWGYINKQGVQITPYIYDKVSTNMINGYGAVKKDGKFGFVDSGGREAVPLVYDEVSYFSNGLAAVKQGNKWGYIDDNNNIIIPFKYSAANAFDDHHAKVKSGNMDYYINTKGERE